jgi:putative ABC transport system permease protein
MEFYMSLVAALGSVELGLAYALLGFGIYISFKILYISDLTADGSFVLGAAVSAMFTLNGMPFLGILAGFSAGALSGIVAALLQTKFGVPPILAGILVMTGLYTVNLGVMDGKSNIPLLNKTTIFTASEEIFGDKLYKIIVLFLVIAVVYILYNIFFKTQLGLSVRATGDNEAMVRASSVNTDLAKIIGLALSNGAVALSGAVITQMQQSADINMGAGMVVIGLASLIIGEILIKNKNVILGFLSVVVGAILYRFLIALILTTSIPPSSLKLISALVVAVAIAIPSLRKKFDLYRLIYSNKNDGSGRK